MRKWLSSIKLSTGIVLSSIKLASRYTQAQMQASSNPIHNSDTSGSDAGDADGASENDQESEVESEAKRACSCDRHDAYIIICLALLAIAVA